MTVKSQLKIPGAGCGQCRALNSRVARIETLSHPRMEHLFPFAGWDPALQFSGSCQCSFQMVMMKKTTLTIRALHSTLRIGFEIFLMYFHSTFPETLNHTSLFSTSRVSVTLESQMHYKLQHLINPRLDLPHC